jgi:hypothetical protein
MYRSTLTLTLALDVGGWSMPHPGISTPGRDPEPVVQDIGWAPGPIWTGVGNLVPTGIRPRTVQPVASPNTDYAIPAMG